MAKSKQYIGARYVPKFYENSNDPNSIEWEAGVAYEPLTIVGYQSDTYTSKIDVPASVGNPSANAKYWARTGEYNALIGALQNTVQALENNIETINNNLYHIETYRSYKKGLSINHTSLQGGCYCTGKNTIVTYLDDQLVKMDMNCKILASNTIAFTSHYNDFTYVPQLNKILISGANDTVGVAVVDYDTLTLDNVLIFSGLTYAINSISYDSIHNVYFAIANDNKGYIIDASTNNVIKSFNLPYSSFVGTVLYQGSFCKNGFFFDFISIQGDASYLYCYDINGDYKYKTLFGIVSQKEVEFIDNYNDGVIVGYLDSLGMPSGLNKMLVVDFQSASIEPPALQTYYVDETLSDNGTGEYFAPFNNLIYAAYMMQGKSNVTLTLNSDITKTAVLFNGINNLTIRGNNHVINNPESNGYGIEFVNCHIYMQEITFNKHIRFNQTNAVMYVCTFENINGNAIVVSNSGELHAQQCIFNDNNTIVRGTWGAKITIQNPTGSGNTRVAQLQNASSLILNYADAISTDDVYLDSYGFSLVNGTVKYYH